MRISTRLWFAGGWWLLPSMIVLGTWYLTSVAARPFTSAEASMVAAMEPTALIFPLAAVAGAMVGARLRQAGHFGRPTSRASWVVVAGFIAPIASTGAAALLTVTLFAMVRDHALGWPGLGVPALYLLILLASICWGLALGRWFRAWIAMALAFVLTYLVLGFPPALEPLWLRHLFGVFGCCTIDQSVNGRALLAAGLVAAGAIAGALLFWSAGPGRPGGWINARAVRRLTGAVLVPAAAFAVAAPMVMSMDANSAVPRPGGVNCSPAGPASRLCAWPEHAGQGGEYAEVFAAVTRVEDTAGMPRTTTYTEASSTSQDADKGRDPRAVVLTARPGLTLGERAAAVADGLATDPVACMNNPNQQGVNGNDGLTVWMVLRQWWHDRLANQLHTEVPPLPSIEPDMVRLARDLATRPQADQGQWVRDVTESRRHCGRNFLPQGMQLRQ